MNTPGDLSGNFSLFQNGPLLWTDSISFRYHADHRHSHCDKWTKEMLTEIRVGQKRRAGGRGWVLWHTPLILTHFTHPSRRTLTFNTPERRRKIFSLPSNNSANEKPPQPQTRALLQWTSGQNCPSPLPPFLDKSILLSLVLRICLRVTIVCLSALVPW